MSYLIEQFNLHLFNAITAIRYVLPILIGFIILERIYPHQRKSLKNELFNLFYTPIYLIVALWMLDYFRTTLLNILDINYYLFKEINISMIFKTALYLIIFDFLYYWFHRAQHSLPFLWRFHSFHHTDDNVSVLSTSRHHWLEEVIRFLPLYLPLILIFGTNPDLPFVALVLPGVYGLFIHLNSNFSFKYIEKIIVTPTFHRIHHSIHKNHYNKNYSILLPIWDILFQTAEFNQDSKTILTGIESQFPPNDLRRLGFYPKL